MKQQSTKYFILMSLIAVLVVPSIALASWWNPFSWNIWNNISHRQTPVTQAVCTKETKLCPDGSTVGREGLKCEFKQCPAANEQYLCQADSDCISSCKWGGINKTWWGKNKEQDCLDGCAGIGFEAKCINRICHTFFAGKLNDSVCSDRDPKYISQGQTTSNYAKQLSATTYEANIKFSVPVKASDLNSNDIKPCVQNASATAGDDPNNKCEVDNSWKFNFSYDNKNQILNIKTTNITANTENRDYGPFNVGCAACTEGLNLTGIRDTNGNTLPDLTIYVHKDYNK